LIQAVKLTQAIKDDIVGRHNAFRRQSNASDMRLMSWSDELAEFAENHAK